MVYLLIHHKLSLMYSTVLGCIMLFFLHIRINYVSISSSLITFFLNYFSYFFFSSFSMECKIINIYLVIYVCKTNHCIIHIYNILLCRSHEKLNPLPHKSKLWAWKLDPPLIGNCIVLR